MLLSFDEISQAIVYGDGKPFLIALIKLNAKKKLLPIQPGDVSKTYADIEESKKDLNFFPKVKISEGIPKFIDWYRKYYKLP